MAKVLFYWNQYTEYHLDRCEAVVERVAPMGVEVHAVQMAGSSEKYAWPSVKGRGGLLLRTLYSGCTVDDISIWRRAYALFVEFVNTKPSVLFLCHSHRPEVFALAVLARIKGTPVYIMSDSRRQDRKRNRLKEFVKFAWYRIYSGAFVSGKSSREYYESLGFGSSVWTGYDTISNRRISSSLELLERPDFSELDFLVVARLVPKKNIALAIEAFAKFQSKSENPRRRLIICGDGPGRLALEEQVRCLECENVVFAGMVAPGRMCNYYAKALVTMVTSSHDQWCLVVNESLAAGVPVLASSSVGAAEELIKPGENGYLFESGDVDALISLMEDVSNNEKLSVSLRRGAQLWSHLGDVSNFSATVEKILQHEGLAC